MLGPLELAPQPDVYQINLPNFKTSRFFPVFSHIVALIPVSACNHIWPLLWIKMNSAVIWFCIVCVLGRGWNERTSWAKRLTCKSPTSSDSIHWEYLNRTFIDFFALCLSFLFIFCPFFPPSLLQGSSRTTRTSWRCRRPWVYGMT